MSTHEPASDRIIHLPAGARAAIIADTPNNDDADIPACVREEVQDAMPDLQLVAAKDFRSMAGPRFSSTVKSVDEVAMVLADPAVQAEARRAGLRYVVIVGGTTESEEYSALGAREQGVRKTTRVEARAWDIPAAEYVGEFAAEARGTTSCIYGICSFAATEGTACERVAQMLAKRLS